MCDLPYVLQELPHRAPRRPIAHLKKNDQGRVRVGALSAGTWRRGHVVGTEAREKDVDGGVRNVDRASMTGTGYIKENKPNS